jgi:hypothetical protein
MDYKIATDRERQRMKITGAQAHWTPRNFRWRALLNEANAATQRRAQAVAARADGLLTRLKRVGTS